MAKWTLDKGHHSSNPRNNRRRGLEAELQVMAAFNWANGRRPAWFIDLRHGNAYEDGILSTDYYATIKVENGNGEDRAQIAIQVKRSWEAATKFRTEHPNIPVLIVTDIACRRLENLWDDLCELVTRERNRITGIISSTSH